MSFRKKLSFRGRRRQFSEINLMGRSATGCLPPGGLAAPARRYTAGRPGRSGCSSSLPPPHPAMAWISSAHATAAVVSLPSNTLGKVCECPRVHWMMRRSGGCHPCEMSCRHPLGGPWASTEGRETAGLVGMSEAPKVSQSPAQ